MRQDISRVIITPPRVGSTSGRRFSRCVIRDVKRERHLVVDEEGVEYNGNYPHRIPIKESRKWRWATEKRFSDHLTPLYRFLEKNVGRKWDDVYSEFAQATKGEGKRHWHARFHFRRMVERVVTGRHDKQYVTVDFGGPVNYREDEFWGWYATAYYVDLNGVLRNDWTRFCEWRREQKKAKEKAHRLCTVNGKSYGYLKGVWYELFFIKPVDATSEQQPTYDGALDAHVDKLGVVVKRRRKDSPSFWSLDRELKSLYGDFVYVWKLRTLSKKEIRNLKLND